MSGCKKRIFLSKNSQAVENVANYKKSHTVSIGTLVMFSARRVPQLAGLVRALIVAAFVVASTSTYLSAKRSPSRTRFPSS